MEDVFLPHPEDSGRQCRLCRPCTRQAFMEAIRQRNFPLICPVCKAAAGQRVPQVRNAEQGDASEIKPLDQSVVCSVLTEDEQREFHQRCLEVWRDASGDVKPCLVADCGGFGFVGPGDERCQCNVCGADWCGECGKDHSVEVTCDDHERWLEENNAGDQRFEAHVREQGMKRCPNCGHSVYKESGCNHMTCRCKHHFCYVCSSTLSANDPYTHYNQAGPGICPLFDGQELPDQEQRQHVRPVIQLPYIPHRLRVARRDIVQFADPWA